MAASETFKAKIPETFMKYVRPETPKNVRLMAAKGTVPMPPSLLATMLTFFLNDPDSEIREAAQESLRAMPKSMVLKIAQEPAHPKTLDFFAREHPAEEPLLEAILLNKLSDDATFAFLAERVTEKLAVIVANNQVRLLRSPSIAEALKKNPHALKSDVDRVVSFLRMHGVLVEGESPVLTPEEVQAILQAPEPLPAAGEAAPAEEMPESMAGAFPDELIEEEEFDEESPDGKQKKESIGRTIAMMNVALKVRLALTGNKEV